MHALDKPFNGLAELARRGATRRLVFGSQVPFLYPEATLALVQEAGLAAAEVEAILEQNWRTNGVVSELVEKMDAESERK